MDNTTLAELLDFYRTHENMTERESLDPSMSTEDIKQIEKDINRTFPHSSYFYSSHAKDKHRGLQNMYDVLIMFVKFDSIDKKCGYVQGMNFIAGEFTYHSCAEYSFCMMIKLMYKFKIIDNYLPQFEKFYEVNN